MTDLMNLWKHSHCISRSAEVFAKHVFKDEWNAALEFRGSKSWLENFSEAVEKLQEGGAQPGKDLFYKGIAQVNDLERQKTMLIERATETIRDRLQKGQYRAFAFDRPRAIETQPVQVPKEVWFVPHSFQRTKIKFRSLDFSEVRLRLVSEDKDPILNAGLAHSKSRPGRPTIKDDVEFVFAAMENRGLVDVKSPANSHFDMVRRLLSEFFPDRYVDPGKPVNEGIRPYFSPLFKELKKNRKQ